MSGHCACSWCSWHKMCTKCLQLAFPQRDGADPAAESRTKVSVDESRQRRGGFGLLVAAGGFEALAGSAQWVSARPCQQAGLPSGNPCLFPSILGLSEVGQVPGAVRRLKWPQLWKGLLTGLDVAGCRHAFPRVLQPVPEQLRSLAPGQTRGLAFKSL